MCLRAPVGRLRAVDQAADLLSQYEQQEQMERQWASQMESEARQRQLELERARVSGRPERETRFRMEGIAVQPG